jgi:hypothetical protein
VAATVLVLTYGDYPHLLGRCLGSILRQDMDDSEVREVRVGLNAASGASWELVEQFVRLHSGRVDFRVFGGPENLKKYPMMRRMLYEDPPVATEHVFWFDDDSAITYPGTDFFGRYLDDHRGDDMAGRILWCGLGGAQPEYVRRQPWYAGKPVARGHKVRFVVGGYRLARTGLLRQWDWPPPELVHRRGDVMLGELCRQQDYALANDHAGVAVNADAELRNDRAPRRGHDEPPLGWIA